MTVGFPQVHITIDKEGFGVPPQHLIQFSYTDSGGNSGSEFSVEMFDATWELLDNRIIPSLVRKRQTIEMRWGWSASKLSERRYGQVTKITPGAVSAAGVRFSLSGLDVGSVVAFDTEPANYEGKISKVVKLVAEKYGWQTVIEETDDILEEDNRRPGKFKRKWRKGQKSDLSFINYLAQRAKSRAAPGPYLAYFDPKTSPPTLHFHPTYSPRSKLYRTYLFQSGGPMEEGVISFEPEVDAAAFTSMGIGNIGIYTNDPLTRKLVKVETDPLKFRDALALGEDVHLPPEGRQVCFHQASATLDEATFRLAAYYEKLSSAANRASLTILGDPMFPVQSFVKVLVMTPKGLPYFTSGIYQVTKATHTISAGSYTTNLALTRNSTMGGDQNHTMPLVSQQMAGEDKGILSNIRSWWSGS